MVRAKRLIARIAALSARKELPAEGVEQIRWHEPKDRTKADAVRVETLETLAQLQE